MKPYSQDLREKIVSAVEKGDSSIRKVAQRFGVSKNCVQRLVTHASDTRAYPPKKARWFNGQSSDEIQSRVDSYL